MIVTKENFPQVCRQIANENVIGLDTETTGLRVYDGDRLFCITISTREHDYYFNFIEYPEFDEVTQEKFDQGCLLEYSCIPDIFRNFKGTAFIHNAKFDQAVLANEGVNFANITVICTSATARLVYNNYQNHKLETLAKECLHEQEKSDKVKEYLIKNKLFEWVHPPGKKKREKKLFFKKCPLSIMVEYACIDSRLHRNLGIFEITQIEKMDQSTPASRPKIAQVFQNEKKLTQVFYNMDRRGVLIDREYVKNAYSHETKKYRILESEFECQTGLPFNDHANTLAPAFNALGENYPRTEKGNPSFTDDALSKMNSPLAKLIREYRAAYKRAGTYANILHHATSDGILHANSKQEGATTGRCSYQNPPMQCMEKIRGETIDGEYYIRRAFIPRPGYKLFMLDFDQFEYRMMLNYAGQMDLIEEVKGGLDVHTATAKMVSIQRDPAKTINFMLLYGGGIQTLANKLKITYEHAKHLREKYFSRLPYVNRLIEQLKNEVSRNGYITNWFGRRCYIDRGFEYKAPNYLIQGGTADWIKVAMNQIDTFLSNKKSSMLLQVHDELMFEIHESELDIVIILKAFMENVTNFKPHNYLPYTVGVDYSDTNWQDKKTWMN